jgi:alkanesulfonate monooxygenase SsuD/methylene tetrahydromethanopterin reductase-like flavin-dependent oxidoreductase (luciferase family)
VPIYFGGLSEPALRRVARLGDGWISDIHSTEELRAI